VPAGRRGLSGGGARRATRTDLDDGADACVHDERGVERPGHGRDARDVAEAADGDAVEVDPDEDLRHPHPPLPALTALDENAYHVQALHGAGARSKRKSWFECRTNSQHGGDQGLQPRPVLVRVHRIDVDLHACHAPQHGRQEHADLDRAQSQAERRRGRHSRGQSKKRRAGCLRRAAGERPIKSVTREPPPGESVQPAVASGMCHVSAVGQEEHVVNASKKSNHAEAHTLHCGLFVRALLRARRAPQSLSRRSNCTLERAPRSLLREPGPIRS
jgi:hypothetical protein